MERREPAGEPFPVKWEEPGDRALSWFLERWHSPDPITPLSHDLQRIVYRGFTRALERSEPPTAQETRRINSYMYITIRPRQPSDPGRTGGPQPPRALNHATWDEEWLPEVQGYLAEWQKFPRWQSSSAELVAQVQRALAWFERCWEIHDCIDFSTSGLVDFCAAHLRWDEEHARRLLTGVESRTLEGDRALRELAAEVRRSVALSRLFRQGDPAELVARLGDDVEGRRFLASLAQYLAEYGRRSDNWVEMSLPSWLEDPTPVLAMVKAQVVANSRGAAALAETGRTARDAADEARRLLAGKPAALREEFDRELAFARRASQLDEEHNYWIDQQTSYWLRQDILRAGELLASVGAIRARDGVFLLRLDELRAALRTGTGDLHQVVDARRAEMLRWRQIAPPSTLGSELASGTSTRVSVLFGNIDGGGSDRAIRGQPASAGTVTGIARLIRSLTEAHRLGPGEVLVAPTTSPPWTPLFGIAGALVTDGGGRLSHAAIVAREYGIAAVVGTVDATRRIRDGQLIRVDGTAGTVELLD